ncbi:MAG: hypothetical protein DI547_01535 [Sphingobium sp.]|jgi:hypothetical protein|nr:MAG: hypothetical protein DI547_01535 [Sphingobium sp.]
MGMFDGILGNVDAIAAKLGVPADQVKAMTETLGARLGEGGDQASALAATAQEHGLSLDALQDMLDGIGGPEAIMGKLGSLLDRDGDGNPLNELGGLAKGLFG